MDSIASFSCFSGEKQEKEAIESMPHHKTQRRYLCWLKFFSYDSQGVFLWLSVP